MYMYNAKQHNAVRQKESVYNMGYIHDTTHKVKHTATMICVKLPNQIFFLFIS